MSPPVVRIVRVGLALFFGGWATMNDVCWRVVKLQKEKKILAAGVCPGCCGGMNRPITRLFGLLLRF